MTYSTEQKNAAAAALCKEFRRLHYGVAREWVTIEAGANNNVFGITVAGHLRKFATMEEGVKAAADLIRTPAYRHVLEAFESPHLPDYCPPIGGGAIHANRQATSLCRSTWHSGAAGLKEQGGLDVFYTRLFRERGYRIT
jgi:hypothetical protein